ncbi:Apolipoprotein N-acyltransferase / Copper homeostasis protein CutE, partial [hydrothermal vent metagenome]
WRLAATKLVAQQDVRLRLVQPAIAQNMKWVPGNRDFIINRLISLSETKTGPDNKGLDGITYLIWPEAALTFFLGDYPEALLRIANMLPPGTVLLTGAPRRGFSASNQKADYNSILAINSDGEVISSYDKTHLVPFGEYLPFKSLFEKFGLRQFVPGLEGWQAGKRRDVLRPEGKAGFLPLICYEAVFSGDLGNGATSAKFILNITNDAWFDGSIGPLQHFYHARLRALEHGVSMVRVANSGVSALVDPLGRISDYLGPGEIGFLDVTLSEPIAPTLFSKLTNWPFLFALLLSWALVLPRYFHYRAR